MADSYATIALISRTYRFAVRITACAAQQGAEEPQAWTEDNKWQWAASPTWAEKVDSWLAANPVDPDGGDGDAWAEDQSVISDLDILSTVQSMLQP